MGQRIISTRKEWISQRIGVSTKVAIAAVVIWLVAPVVAFFPVQAQELRVCSYDPIVWCQVGVTTYPFINLGLVLFWVGLAIMGVAVYSGVRERNRVRQKGS